MLVMRMVEVDDTVRERESERPLAARAAEIFPRRSGRQRPSLQALAVTILVSSQRAFYCR
jgi:hypothetical protein